MQSIVHFQPRPHGIVPPPPEPFEIDIEKEKCPGNEVGAS